MTYENIPIQLLSAARNNDANYQATVRVDSGQMVLNVRDDNDQLYLIKGTVPPGKHFFAGVDSLTHEVPVHLVARWSLLGDVYVGIWIEDGQEWLFSFHLPRKSDVVAVRR